MVGIFEWVNHHVDIVVLVPGIFGIRLAVHEIFAVNRIFIDLDVFYARCAQLLAVIISFGKFELHMNVFALNCVEADVVYMP